jgi:hypothetical protein
MRNRMQTTVKKFPLVIHADLCMLCIPLTSHADPVLCIPLNNYIRLQTVEWWCPNRDSKRTSPKYKSEHCRYANLLSERVISLCLCE